MRLEVRKSSRLVPGNAEAQFFSNRQPPGPRDLSHNDRHGGRLSRHGCCPKPGTRSWTTPSPTKSPRPPPISPRLHSARKRMPAPQGPNSPLGAPPLARSAAVGSSPRSNTLLLPGQPPGATGWPQSLSQNILKVASIATKLCRCDVLVRFDPLPPGLYESGPSALEEVSRGVFRSERPQNFALQALTRHVM